MKSRAYLFIFLSFFIVILFVILSLIPVKDRYQIIGRIQNSGHIGPSDIYPNPIRTPGSINSQITQATIGQTICNPTWSTKSIRPPARYTTSLKIKQIQEYGYQDTKTTGYEEDHLISLELGGNPTDPKNLWPEPYSASIGDGGAKIKDTVENYLHKQICSGALTLQQAQSEVVTDWYAVYKDMTKNLGSEINYVDNDDN